MIKIKHIIVLKGLSGLAKVALREAFPKFGNIYMLSENYDTLSFK